MEHDIERLEEEWKQLVPDSASPFQTFGWNRAWLLHASDYVDEVLIFTLRSEAGVEAILPCYRKGKEIRLIGDPTCDYQEVITQSFESARRIVTSVLKWLEREARSCRLVFDRLPEEGHLYHALEAARKSRSNFFHYKKRFFPCPFVDLGGGLDEYLLARPSKVRGDRKRAIRRMEKKFPDARVDIYRGSEIDQKIFDRATGFHLEHFRKKAANPLEEGPLRNILKEVISDPDVGLQVALLQTGDQLMAVELGFARGSRFYGFITAFDAAYRSVAPGKYSVLRRIDEWVKVDGVKTLDLLAGDESYKKGYTDGQCYWVGSVQVMPKRPTNFFRYVALELNKGAREVAKAVLRKLGLR